MTFPPYTASGALMAVLVTGAWLQSFRSVPVDDEHAPSLSRHPVREAFPIAEFVREQFIAAIGLRDLDDERAHRVRPVRGLSAVQAMPIWLSKPSHVVFDPVVVRALSFILLPRSPPRESSAEWNVIAQPLDFEPTLVGSKLIVVRTKALDLTGGIGADILAPEGCPGFCVFDGADFLTGGRRGDQLRHGLGESALRGAAIEDDQLIQLGRAVERGTPDLRHYVGAELCLAV